MEVNFPSPLQTVIPPFYSKETCRLDYSTATITTTTTHEATVMMTMKLIPVFFVLLSILPIYPSHKMVGKKIGLIIVTNFAAR